MGLLIDGFNLIYKFPELEGFMYAGKLNEARNGLLGILKEYHDIKPVGIRIIFDGKRNQGDQTYQERVGGFDIYYSHDYSADYLIKEFVKNDLNPRMITVVTSDNDIISYVVRFRAQTIKSEAFAEQINAAIAKHRGVKEPEKETNPSLTDEDISYWEELFKNRP